MLNEDQVKLYQNEGLIKSPTCLSKIKVEELNSALDKYLLDHKNENNEFVSGLYERDEAFLRLYSFEKYLRYFKITFCLGYLSFQVQFLKIFFEKVKP